DSRQLLVATLDGTARVWDLLAQAAPAGPHPYDFTCGSAHRLGERLPGNEQRRYSPDGTRRLQFGERPGVEIVSRATGAPAGPSIETGRPVDSAAFSPDGSRVWTIVGSQVQAWNQTSGQPVGPPVSISPEPSQVVINANGARLCTVDAARQTVDVWDLD